MRSSFRLTVEYNGHRFHGFQSQNSSNNNNGNDGDNNSNNNKLNKKHYQRISKRPRYDTQGQVVVVDKSSAAATTTIQDCLQDAICHWSGQADVSSLSLRYCSRTDKGVHAKGQVVAITLTRLPAELLSMDSNSHNNKLSAAADDGQKNSKDPAADATAAVVVVNSAFLQQQMRKSINSRLPWDISVSSITTCSNSFHPRHDVKLKQYSYTIKYHRKVRDVTAVAATTTCVNEEDFGGGGIHALRNALQDGPCLWLCPWPLDDSRMALICEQLQGCHDYGAFWHRDVRRKYQQEAMLSPSSRPVQDIKRFAVEIIQEQQQQDDNDDDRHEPTIVLAKFTLRAKSFQRTQCRNMVGLVVDICRGHVPESMLDQVFATGAQDNRQGNDNDDHHVEKMASIISAAPASGLCLDQVWYHQDIVEEK